jgi:predicted acyl esterase
MKRRMILEKDVAVPMRDGAVLRCNVFRPDTPGTFPVLMTFGPYGKDVHLSQFMPEAWEALQRRHPEVFKASTCKYLVFETPDPEMWVPEGYVVVKVDSRGSGKSPGRLDVNSPAEFRDFHDAIEWAAVRPWASGKVGLLGISYYAAGQWMIAAERPPHLAAMLPWQGTYDFYRDRTRQGGILGAGFLHRWWNRSVLRNQHGNPDTPLLDIDTGLRNTGPESLSPEQLAANREDYIGNLLARPLNGPWYEERSADLGRIRIPALVVANWGGLGLHLRGTILGYLGIASKEKWLKVQSGSYFFTFLLPQNVALQRKFFDRYLKGVDNGWENEPKVEVAVRAADDTVARVVHDTQWPLSGTKWTRFYLDASGMTLLAAPPQRPSSASYPAAGEGLTFSTAPLERPLEFAGPIKAKLFVSSSTNDMDLFATLRAFDPNGKEVTFFSAVEPRAPVSQGWLRVSQRKVDPKRSSAHQPWHPHDEPQKLKPGEIVEVDIEIWPGSAARPAGYRLALTLQGKDFERPGETGPMRGVAWFTHDDPTDRPPERFDGTNTLYTGGARDSYLLMPLVS